MSERDVVVRCPKCATKNRVPANRWGESPRCGKCKEKLALSTLFPDTSIDVNDSTFRREVGSFAGPVVVDFTAPW